MNIAVVGHHSRSSQAEALAELLDAELFLDRLTLGATWNHLRALNWGAGKTGHLTILEDDAEPVPNFLDLASNWIDHHPEDLTSFYLGMGTPPTYQARIGESLAAADEAGVDHITLPALITAVAYTIPCVAIRHIPHDPRRVADFGLGRAWVKTTHRPIHYTIPSYVQHADHPSIQQTRRLPARKAWRLAE